MDQAKILRLESMELSKYEDVGLDHLVMYSIGNV